MVSDVMPGHAAGGSGAIATVTPGPAPATVIVVLGVLLSVTVDVAHENVAAASLTEAKQSIISSMLDVARAIRRTAVILPP
jgi:hypothetical protein